MNISFQLHCINTKEYNCCKSMFSIGMFIFWWHKIMNNCFNIHQSGFAFMTSTVSSVTVWDSCAENKVLTLIYGYILKATSDKLTLSLTLPRYNLTNNSLSRTAHRLLTGLTKCTQTQVAWDSWLLISDALPILGAPARCALVPSAACRIHRVWWGRRELWVRYMWHMHILNMQGGRGGAVLSQNV